MCDLDIVNLRIFFKVILTNFVALSAQVDNSSADFFSVLKGLANQYE